MTDHCGATKRDGSGDQCELPAGWGTDDDSGRCKYHGGAVEGQGAPEGNDNATKHGAWSESFVTDFLTDQEIERVRQAEDLLGVPEDAQDLATSVAAIALEQFRRSGDERFLRRYESICDTFGIAPDDVQKHEVTGEDGGPVQFTVERTVVETDEYDE